MSRKAAQKYDGMPDPSDGPAGDFPSFLRADDLGKKEGARGVISFLGKTPRKVSSQFGTQWAFPVKFKNKVYDWAIKEDSGNHRRIFDRWGRKTPKGTVKVEIKTFNRNRYIAIV